MMLYSLPTGCSLQYPCKVKATSRSVFLPRRHTATLVAYSSSLQVENASKSSDSVQDGPVRYGIVTSQGPRETMEDVAFVVEQGPCGFLFAGMWHAMSIIIVISSFIPC